MGGVGGGAERRMGKFMPKAGDFLFAGAVDWWKIYAEVRGLVLLYRRKNEK